MSFLTLDIRKDGTDQERFLKEQIPEINLNDYSDKGCLPNQDALRILYQAEMVVYAQ